MDMNAQAGGGSPPNLFRRGFSNVSGETTADDLKSEGEIPSWVHGSYITNGPAIFDLKGYSFSHWFDGLAMLVSFSFSGARVGYASRFVKSDDYKDYAEKGTVSSITFATAGRKTGLDRIRPGGKGGDNANVNVARIGRHFYTLDESPPVLEFDPRTLETGEEIRDRFPVEGQVTTAHPVGDPATGELVNYVIHYGLKTTYNIFSVKDDLKNPRLIASVPVKEPSYMHSFAMTPGYVILAQNSLVASPLGFVASAKPFIDHYVWKPELGTRFTVVPRAGGAALERKTGPLFCYHHVNAFEKGGSIYCDLVSYPDHFMVDSLRLENLRSDTPRRLHAGELKRYVIPLGEKEAVSSVRLSGTGLEFPKIDPRKALKEYRFVYGAGQTLRDGTGFLDQLVKIDIIEGMTKKWTAAGCYPGEPVFVPRPGGTAEDDGIVMSIVLDTTGEKSFLLLLDATSFKETARIDAPQLIPFRFHGNFFGTSDMPA